MPTEEPLQSVTPIQAKSTCVAHQCPKCYITHHVSVEQVLTGDITVIWCHCRACGHSWHPVRQETRDS